MCKFKATEHKMTPADVRRVAREVVWNNSPAAIAEDAAAITSAYLANDIYRPSYVDGIYWQPDTSNTYADRHLVTDAQFDKLTAEVDKQAQRVSKLLNHPRTNA